MLRFLSLGSGSKGNATLVSNGRDLLLIDCGFSLKELLARLESVAVAPEDISAVLVTHEHGDHVKGAGAFSRRFRCPLYSTFGTATAVSERAAHFTGSDWRELRPGRNITLTSMDILPVLVPHDAREPCQFIVRESNLSFGMLTDLGAITDHVIEAFSACDGLMLECNHDPQMLQAGPYPLSLKQRVSGNHGHLSNQQAAEFLTQCNRGQLQHLVLSHLSEQNNSEDLAMAAIHSANQGFQGQLHVASQQQNLGWLTLN